MFFPLPRCEVKFRAFSLLELLAVTAIIAVLATAAAPVMMQSGRATKGLVEIAGTLEMARAYAVSHNTHVWVAFTSGSPVQLTVFASADGSGLGLMPGDSITAPSAQLVQIERVKTLENCRVGDELPSGNVLAVDGSGLDGESASRGPEFNYGTGANQIDFTNSVMFSPSGQVRVGSVLPGKMKVVVVPTHGGSQDDAANAAIVQVSGLTGRVKVIRP